MADRFQPLRTQVKLLGSILGQVIVKQEDQLTLDLIEKIRRLSKDARGGQQESWTQLAQELKTLPLPKMLPIARSFAHFLALANVAEQHHRVRRRRDYLFQDQTQPESLAAMIPTLLEQGFDAQHVKETLQSLQIELVLTAHPTEVNRRTLLQKYQSIQEVLSSLDQTPPSFHHQYQQELERLITEIWCTDEVHRSKPSPLDEARAGLLIFENSLWEAVPKYLR